MNPTLCGNRTVTITFSGQKLDTKEVAEILARHITGGDYAGYLRQVAEKEKKAG